MKIWLKRLLLSLLLLILVVAGMSSLLLGTGSGVQWLFEIGNRFIPGELSVEQTEGSLLSDLQLHQLRYRSADMRVEVEDVVFNWNPSSLFSGVFHLRELSLNKLRYQQLRISENKQQPSQEPIKLPDIDLPLQLKLDLIQAKSVEIISQPDANPLVVEQLKLIAGWGKNGIDLTQLSVAMPMLDFHGKGHLDPRSRYPVDLDLDWALDATELPKLTGKGRLKGDLDALNIQHSIDGDLIAEISANLRDVLDKLNWDTQIIASKLPPAYLPLAHTADIALNIDAQGDLVRADSTIKFTVSDSDKPQTVEDSHLRLNVVAGIGFSDQHFQLQGDWKKLQWPLTGAAQIEAASGNLSASGKPDQYVFNLQSQLSGDGIPVGDWQLQGKGGLEKLHLDELLGNVLDGKLNASGDFSWSPIVSWDLEVTTKDINPQQLSPEWPGKINADISSSGKIPDSGIELAAEIKELAGILRDQPIAGRGSIQMRGSELKIEDIKLSSGSAKVSVAGDFGKTWALDWKLDVDDLADLVPQGKGSIQGTGLLKGTQKKPVVEGNVQVRGIDAQGVQCERCDLEFNLGLDESYLSHLKLSGKNLLASGQKLHELALNLDGSLQKHTLVLTADHEQVDLAFSATGSYLQDKEAWQGDIQQLDLDAGEMGQWKQQKPASLYASAKALKLSPLCLQDKDSLLCTQINRVDKQGDAKLQVKNLSLQRARPWLPPEISELSGIVQLDAKADLGQTPAASVKLVLEPGNISFLDPLSKPISMALRDGKVDVIYDNDNLSANWHLGVGANDLQGSLLIPRKALDADPMTAPLKGAIKIVVPELNLISAFLPDIQKIDGNVDVALNLDGTLGDPSVKGHALIKSSEILIPRAGLKLRDLNMELKGNGGEKLLISGGVHSGEGELNLLGDVLLNADQGWPAKISLKGQAFQLANLPEAQVEITPDLTLESNKDLIKIRGRLGVPVALIEVNDLPESSRGLSSDVIIANDDGSVGEIADSKIDAQVTIVLGEKVHFSGFGLKADIGGRLTVNQNAGKFPTANGELKIEDGSFRAYGQNLKIERGRVSYAGGRIDNPGVRLRASRKIEDIVVGVELSGTAKKPQLSTFSSDPDLLQRDVVSMLLTGQKSDDLENVKIYTGRQITPDLSVGVNIGGGSDGSEFVARYRLLDNVSLEGTSSAKKSGGSINYTIELE